jgi:ABC-type polysaccharide/polyol phosphate export permease
MDSPTPGNAQVLGAEAKQSSARTKTRRRPISVTELIRDVIASLRTPGFWLYGAWIDTSLRYRSQALGPMWMIAGTLVFVLVLGTLYSQVFSTQNPLYYAHLATGYVCWIFMQQLLVKSARLYSHNRNMIQNGYVKYADYVLRLFSAQLINFVHNLLVVAGVLLVTQVPLTSAAWILLLTVPLLMVTLLGACFLIAVIGARYPDFGELLQTTLRLAFFVTPIIWYPGAVGKGAIIGPFLYLNPFYYLIEIVRAPLVYGHVPWLEIGVVAATTVIIWALASDVYARAKPYIPLWI